MGDLLAFFDLTPLDAQMILIMCVVFFLFYKLITTFFFAPLLNVIEAREYLTEGVYEEAKRLEDKAEELLKESRNEELRCRVRALEDKLKVLESAKQEASLMVKKAQEEAEDLLREEKSLMEEEVGKVRDELKNQLNNFVEEAFNRLSCQSLN